MSGPCALPGPGMAGHRHQGALLRLVFAHRLWREVSETGFPVRGGILEGCSASGSLRAILVDLVVRRLRASHLEPHGSLVAFLDDLAAAFWGVLSGLGPVIDMCMALPRTTGLHLHIPKTFVSYWSSLSNFELKRRVLDRIGVAACTISRSARHLDVSLGPRAHNSVWDQLAAKYSLRCAALRAALGPLQERLARYSIYCLSSSPLSAKCRLSSRPR